MTQENQTKKTNISLAFTLFLGALSIANFWGLFYLYQQHNHDQIEFKNILKLDLLLAKDLKSQIIGGLERQSISDNEITKIKKSLEQIAIQKHDNELLRIEWLLSQAEWQLNVLKQVRYSKAYLRQAKKMASSQDFHSLADAIHQDLMNLKQAGITPLDQILSEISAIKQQLDDLNPLPVKAIAPPTTDDVSPKIQSAITILKPFIKIEHYHETPQKFLTAEDQAIIIQNLELLLAEIQYAAITSQQALFKQLLQLFEKETQVLDAKTTLNPMITKLKNKKLQLAHPIQLKSLSIVHQLLLQKSAP